MGAHGLPGEEEPPGDLTRAISHAPSVSRGVGASHLPCAELLRPVRRLIEHLVISMPTVKTHVGSLLAAKLHARYRAQRVIIAWSGLAERGLAA